MNLTENTPKDNSRTRDSSEALTGAPAGDHIEPRSGSVSGSLSSVLVVDDREENLLALEHLLRPLKVDVVKASSGKQALELLLRQEFALAIVDVQMPEMNGYELAQLMRGLEKTQRIPIIFVTAGTTDTQSIFQGYQAGAVDYLVKPLNPDILRNKVGVFLLLHEQTRLLRAQVEETARAKETLRLATSAAKVGVWRWDTQTNVVEWNAEHFFLLGYEVPLKQPTYADWRVRVHPADLAKVEDDLRVAVQNGVEFKSEYRIVHPDGETHYVQGRGCASYLENGEVRSMAGVIVDITDRKNAEIAQQSLLKDLQERSGLLQTILEQMPLSVIIGEAPSGRLIFANSKMTDVWRFPLIESQSTDAYAEWVAYHEDGRRYAGNDWPLARAITKGEIVTNEDTCVLLGDGTRATLRLNAAPIRDASGAIIAGIVLAEDVTALKRTEQELKSAKEAAEAASHAKTAFLANVSHEIRTPLAAIIGFNNLLQTPDLDESSRQEYLTRITRNSDQLALLINDLLDLSKAEANRLDAEMIAFSPRKVIEDALSTLSLTASEKNILLKVEWLSELPNVAVSDPARMRQILVNIVGNALKFTDRGSVSLQVETQPNASGHTLRMRIIDTGVGMSESQRERLFQPFVQADASISRRFGGTGLGLVLSRNLARLLGGDLMLEKTVPGEGSVFLATLQLKEAGVSRPARKSASSVADTGASPLGSKRILVVDDSPDNRTIVSLYLKRAGAIVETAHDGEDAIRVCTGTPPYDAILMDLQMPKMDGTAALRKLRALGRKEPIIVVTAHAMKGERERCLALGFDEYLSKPINREQLIQMLGEVVEAREGSTNEI